MKAASLVRLIDAQLITPKAAVQALEPGSQMDVTLLTTHCPSCGAVIEQAVRWFTSRQFACDCGGRFSVEPLCESLRRALLGDATPVPELREVSVEVVGNS